MGKICHTGSHVVRLVFGLLLTESTLIILFPAPEFLKKKLAGRGQGRQKKDNYERRREKKKSQEKVGEGRTAKAIFISRLPTNSTHPTLIKPTLHALSSQFLNSSSPNFGHQSLDQE